jgi:hypothetical protein
MATIQQKLRQKRQRSYLGKDFDALRDNLTTYAKSYYSDQIKDVSESSVAGMFIDMAAYTGDVLSYYLDYQFNELDLASATDVNNIERLVRRAGVKIGGASPAIVNVNFYAVIPAQVVNGNYQPNTQYLPIIQSGTQVTSNSGIIFELAEDIDFGAVDSDGNLTTEYKIFSQDASGNPTRFVMKGIGICSSARISIETFTIDDAFVPFRTLTLSNQNVSEIISIFDSENNQYYEVESLTHDVVYKAVTNTRQDADVVEDSLTVIPAPRRFISSASRVTGRTTITFGSGDAQSLDDDIIPDPSELALPLYGSKKTFNKASIDPNTLLQTRSLGISPTNTTITVTYRYGGGLNNNVGSGTINSINRLIHRFPPSTPTSIASTIRATFEVDNTETAVGGEDALTLEDLRSIALSYSNSQNRIVTKQDAAARIYTMPSNFGRVYRAGFRPNPVNPLATLMYIVSRNSAGQLILSSDTLKVNLSKYLNEFRLISDAIDIVDAPIVNIRVKYTVTLNSTAVKNTTLQKINQSLKDYFNIKNFQIDQSILTSDVMNILLNTDGVTTVTNLTFESVNGNINGTEYSDVIFNVSQNTLNGLIVPPPGGIFEVRYPDFDIIGNVS